MEFFARLELPAGAEALQQRLEIGALPACCDSIYEVRRHDGEVGEINTIWGVFEVRRELIRGGVRFTLPGCPNAFAWTVTTGLAPDPGAVVVHATINRQEHDPDFIESIETFVADWRRGLLRGLMP